MFKIDPNTENNKSIHLELVKNKQKKITEGYKEEIRFWADKFEEKHGRKPLESELIDNLQDKMNPDILQKYVTEYLILIINNQADEMV